MIITVEPTSQVLAITAIADTTNPQQIGHPDKCHRKQHVSITKD